jgi:hypothetical protein
MNDEQFLPTKLVCHRYCTTERTIDRWTARGVLPKPDIINGRKYWRRSALERAEREGMGRRATHKPPHTEPLDAA